MLERSEGILWMRIGRRQKQGPILSQIHFGDEEMQDTGGFIIFVSNESWDFGR